MSIKRYIGIDLSTSPEDIGVCTLTESSAGTLELTDSPSTVAFRGNPDRGQKLLFDFIESRVRDFHHPVTLALDVPFGWPDAFANALERHSVGKSFGNKPRNHYRYRKTELLITDILERDLENKVKLHPLSVSTDRLGLTAIWASELIQKLTTKLKFRIALVQYETGVDRTLIEVYPSASVLSWYPALWRTIRNKPAHEKYLDIRRAVIKGANHHFADYPVTACDIWNRHHLDAFICALTAKNHSEDLCYGPADFPEENISHEVFCREGWIMVPRPAKASQLSGQ